MVKRWRLEDGASGVACVHYSTGGWEWYAFPVDQPGLSAVMASYFWDLWPFFLGFWVPQNWFCRM